MDNNEIIPNYFPIKIENRTIRVSTKEAKLYSSLLEWIEGTSLFHAIKNDPEGMNIVAQDGSLSLQLSKNVQHADELPPVVLLEFYMNSPFYQNPVYTPVRNLLITNSNT